MNGLSLLGSWRLLLGESQTGASPCSSDLCQQQLANSWFYPDQQSKIQITHRKIATYGVPHLLTFPKAADTTETQRSVILHMQDSISKVNSTSLCIAMTGVPSPTAPGGHKAVTRTLHKGKAPKSAIRPVPLLPCELVHRNSYRPLHCKEGIMASSPAWFNPTMIQLERVMRPPQPDTVQSRSLQSWIKQAQQPTFQMASGLTGGTAAARKGLLSE